MFISNKLINIDSVFYNYEYKYLRIVYFIYIASK
jgi:hypothetical protein